MAERNQNVLNGAPPQLFPSDSIAQQSGYTNQSQSTVMTSPGLDQSSYFHSMQKHPGLMVNGQISSVNVRSFNANQQPGQLTNSSNDVGDSRIAHQTKLKSQTLETSSVQAVNSASSSPGNPLQRVTYGSNAPVNRQSIGAPSNLSTAQVGKSEMQTSTYGPLFNSNVQSNVPFTQMQQPSPQLVNKLNVMPPGNPQFTQQVSSYSQPVPYNNNNNNNVSQIQYQQTGRPNTVQQFQGAPPYGGPSATGVERQKPTSNDTSKTAPSAFDSSPFNKPNLMNPTGKSSNINPQQSSQSSLQQIPLRGSRPSPPIPNVTQSFPSYNNQPGLAANRWPGVPQGYQPAGAAPSQPPPGGATVNSSVSSSAPPPGQVGHVTPSLRNQLTPNRVAHGPLQSSTQTPPVVPASRGPLPPANRLPSPPTNAATSRYPSVNALSHGLERMSVTKHGFNRMWGLETVDLLQCRNVLPPQKVTPPPIRLNQEFLDSVNCSSETFCCTMNKIPETNSLLQKSRLPLGILIHPFRDLNQLAVIQCASIVRCRACRTYINPFVYFVDNKRWKCNLCFRVNELSDEFQFDPMSKTYGDPSRRPEIRNSTIEFIAPSEYMLRPPQPAIYLFVLDVSRSGCDSGYLETFCSVLLDEIDNLPGDCRTQIGFILFDSYIHFFSIAENYTQAHEMIVTDINDVFLPSPDSLLVNLNENKQLVRDLLQELPRKYFESYDTGSALGAALQAAYKLMSPTGGRITLFQSCLPNIGPGNLSSREDPNQRSAKDVRHLGPQTDFYKRLALNCSTQQISVDLFLVSSQYSDLATVGGVSQFSGGCIYHFPMFRKFNVDINERLVRALRRYFTRKIGFEAVMRVRCSRGLAIHTFYGNFFVRSTDLLSLPNVNPDAGFGMQVAIEDSLCELQTVCFQAAVLYTSAKGERRIRVHTLCLPVSSNLSDILTSADQQAIVGLLGKMAVDRSIESSLSDAREAFVNVAIDILSAYKLVETSGGPNTILAPLNLSLIPLYILALLKSTAFRTGQSTRLDDRIFAMSQMKTLPLRTLIQQLHPDLYNVTELDDETDVEFEDKMVAQPPRLSLSSEHLDSRGAFLLDTPEVIYLLLGRNIDRSFLNTILDVNNINEIGNDMVDLPELETDESEKLRHFINYLQSEKAWPAIVKVITEPNMWHSFLINDKAENAFSYFELLHHVKAQMK